MVDMSFQVLTLCNLTLVKNQVIKRGVDTLGVIAHSLKSVICMKGALRYWICSEKRELFQKLVCEMWFDVYPG